MVFIKYSKLKIDKVFVKKEISKDPKESNNQNPKEDNNTENLNKPVE